MKLSSIKEATDYVYGQLKEINPAIERDDVHYAIVDEILESAEYTLTEADIKFLEANEKNADGVDEYLHNKIPDYTNLLSDIVTDMVSEEILENE